MIFIKEQGHVHKYILSSKCYTPSSDFKTVNVMYSLCHSVRHINAIFKNKQKANRKDNTQTNDTRC